MLGGRLAFLTHTNWWGLCVWISVSELEKTLLDIGGADMSIDLAEFVEFLHQLVGCRLGLDWG